MLTKPDKRLPSTSFALFDGMLEPHDLPKKPFPQRDSMRQIRTPFMIPYIKLRQSSIQSAEIALVVKDDYTDYAAIGASPHAIKSVKSLTDIDSSSNVVRRFPFFLAWNCRIKRHPFFEIKFANLQPIMLEGAIILHLQIGDLCV